MVREIRFISSWAIVNYIVDNPINWDPNGDGLDWLRAKRGGEGDRAHPEMVLPMVEMWLRLLNLKKGLFTQIEFEEYALKEYAPWPPEEFKNGVRAKLYRNFYPSMIDHIYAFALLSESGIFKSVDYDTDEDVTKKIDIYLTRHDGQHLGLALRIGTATARECQEYKYYIRGQPVQPFVVEPIVLDTKRRGPRSRGAGNKRWYVLEDFKKAIDWAKAGGWHGPINQ